MCAPVCWCVPRLPTCLRVCVRVHVCVCVTDLEKGGSVGGARDEEPISPFTPPPIPCCASPPGKERLPSHHLPVLFSSSSLFCCSFLFSPPRSFPFLLSSPLFLPPFCASTTLFFFHLSFLHIVCRHFLSFISSPFRLSPCFLSFPFCSCSLLSSLHFPCLLPLFHLLISPLIYSPIFQFLFFFISPLAYIIMPRPLLHFFNSPLSSHASLPPLSVDILSLNKCGLIQHLLSAAKVLCMKAKKRNRHV